MTQDEPASKLRLRISMSLDGFVAGPDQSVQNPDVTHLKYARR